MARCYHPSALDVERKALASGAKRKMDSIRVRCGSCIGCRQHHARAWALRLSHESQLNPSAAWFLTLTYDEENVPEYGSLEPDHLAPFIRRLRDDQPERLRYYLCGEYGGKTLRPHYHLALFGAHFPDRDPLRGNGPGSVWTSRLLERAWPYGFSEFSALSYPACAYVAGYVNKKVRKKDFPDAYTRVDPATGETHDIVPEFARMSRRPGIARDWITRYWRDVYPRDYVVLHGRKWKPPRYYDKWIEENQPEVWEETYHKRAQQLAEGGPTDWGDLEDRILPNAEEIHLAKTRLFNQRDAV